MPFEREAHPMLKNHMEVLVESHLPSMLEKHPHIASCANCRTDVMAIALNNLRPHYTRTGKGYVFTKLKELDHQFQSDVTKELMRAIKIVEENPRHDEPNA